MKFIRNKTFPLLLIIICLTLYLLGSIVYARNLNKKISVFHTYPILNIDKTYKAYLLISPYNRVLSDDSSKLGKIYLLDMMGNSIHTWKVKHQPLYSVLEKNSNLITVMERPKYSTMYPPGGNTGIIQELNWKSDVLWEYEDESLHHDVYPMENGNLLLSEWVKTPKEIGSRISGGVKGTELDGLMWSDKIIELDRNKNIVWSWISYKHLDPAVDILDPLMPRYAWTVTNGISYAKSNPLDGQEAIILSMRSLSTVFIIRKSDGKILWRSPKGMLNTQHDPNILPNGNILVFDNGAARIPNPFVSYASRVIEINPKTNKIEWQFDGGEGVIDKLSFFAPLVGGAQRLPNGNTLITDGPKGHIFEVTNDKEVVWDMINPYTTQLSGKFPSNFLFKTRLYGKDDIDWPEKIPDPLNPINWMKVQFLEKIYNFN